MHNLTPPFLSLPTLSPKKTHQGAEWAPAVRATAALLVGFIHFSDGLLSHPAGDSANPLQPRNSDDLELRSGFQLHKPTRKRKCRFAILRLKLRTSNRMIGRGVRYRIWFSNEVLALPLFLHNKNDEQQGCIASLRRKRRKCLNSIPLTFSP
jgi:hypothetical protein